jgi:hypothetical protein
MLRARNPSSSKHMPTYRLRDIILTEVIQMREYSDYLATLIISGNCNDASNALSIYKVMKLPWTEEELLSERERGMKDYLDYEKERHGRS